MNDSRITLNHRRWEGGLPKLARARAALPQPRTTSKQPHIRCRSVQAPAHEDTRRKNQELPHMRCRSLRLLGTEHTEEGKSNPNPILYRCKKTKVIPAAECWNGTSNYALLRCVSCLFSGSPYSFRRG